MPNPVLSRQLIVKHLQLAHIPSCRDARHRAPCSCNHDSHVSGWDLNQAIREVMVERGERLMQFVTNSSASRPFQETGNYFTWAGSHGMSSLGIGSGLAGRTRNEFLVARPTQALVGTAAAISRRAATASGFALGGRGGADQIFLADKGLGSLVPGNADLANY